MDHKLVLENSSSAPACLHTAEYHYLLEGHKEFEYQTETDLLSEPGT